MKKLCYKSLKIFWADLKKIGTNWVSLIILTGLVLLPSLYAWVNIYAGWDPYGNTKGVKVAIVNLDEGCDFQNTPIHIGQDVVSSLKENHKLGWTFLDNEEKGLDLVQKGDVYATIIIPKDFSRKMITLLDAKPMKPELEYYVNEKINAIAPKMTDSGANTLQKEITTSFVETVADKVIAILGDAGIELDQDYPTITHVEDMLSTLDKHFPEIEAGVNNLATKAKDGKIVLNKHDDEYISLQNTLSTLISCNQQIDEFLGELDAFSSDSIPKLKESLSLAQNMFMDIAESCNNLQNTLITDKPIFLGDIDTAITNLEILKSRTDTLCTQITQFDHSLGQNVSTSQDAINETISSTINLLNKLKENLDDPSKVLEILKQLDTSLTTLTKQLESLKSLVTQIGTSTDDLLAKLQEIANNLNLLSLTPNDSALINQILNELKNYTQASSGAPQAFDSAKPLVAHMTQSLSTPDTLSTESLQVQSTNLSTLIQSLRTLLNTNTQNLLTMITSTQELLIEVHNSCNTIGDFITSASKDSTSSIQQIINNLNVLQDTLNTSLDTLKTSTHSNSILLEKDLDRIATNLTSLQDRLGALQDAIASDTTTLDLLNTISLLAYNIQSQLGALNNALDNDFIGNLQRNILSTSGLVDNLTTLFTALKEDLTTLDQFANTLASQDTILLSDLNTLQTKLPEIKKLVHTANEKVNLLNGEVNLQSLITNMTMDNSAKSDFLASPVVLNSHKLYPLANYGAGMTPFYTTLCLWVGALLLTALLSTKAKNASFEYTPIQEFFGKYLLFLLLAMLQGLMASLGDIFVLGVEIKEPILFVLLAIFYSMIFSGIIYTLVSLFGNVGKALGVILLVLQLAGSGGTFPIQVIPASLQKLSKFLPFTYAIGGMREAVAGVSFDNLMLDLGMLIVFFIMFMILGVLLKQKANKFLHKFAHKLGESGVIEH
ncbi:MAG: YhgE/Pip family protein [Cellulosilyticaceae bacterium]